MSLYTVASLWIGPELSWMEQLCLQSFLDHGHRTILYSYDPIKSVPDGVECRDAREIMPTEEIIYHKNTGSPAFHSDVFRLRMLAATDYLWIDTDAYCLKPFERPENGHMYGWGTDKRRIICTGVLGLPHDSPSLQGMLKLTEDAYPIPPWMSEEKQEELRQRKAVGEGVHMSLMPWGICGPEALHYFLHETGEVEHALAGPVLYPVSFGNTRIFHRPHLKRLVHEAITEDTISVHFYGRRFRNIFAQTDGIPPEGSYVDDLIKQHGIDPKPTAHLYVLKEPGKVEDTEEKVAS